MSSVYYDRLSDLGIKLTRTNGQEKTFCPNCHDGRKNKRDKSLSVSINTGSYRCHNCGFHGNVRTFTVKESVKKYQRPPQDVLQRAELSDRIEKWFASRKISKSTLNRFHIFGKEEKMPQTNKVERCIVFPYIREGDIINLKYRDGAKNFKMSYGAELILFGMQTLEGRTRMIITEGEIDALSVYEAGIGHGVEEPFVVEETGELVEDPKKELASWAICSVPNGASKPIDGKVSGAALEYLDNCAEWLVTVDEFIVATDNDVAGRALRDELTRRLGVEKCKVVKYPEDKVVPIKGAANRACKDLNEVLMYLGDDKVREVVMGAKFIPVEGIYELKDCWPVMEENFDRGIELGATTRFGVDADYYFRWKKGEQNGWAGYGNWGKTTLVCQMMLTKSIWDGWKWAIFSPENYPAGDFYDDLIEMYVGKALTKMTKDEYINAALFVNEHIFYVYPEDNHNLETIHEKFRYLVLMKGVDGVLLDPWNQLDHNQRSGQTVDQYLSMQLKTTKKFAQMNMTSYNIVIHAKNPDPVGHDKDGNPKRLPVVDMYDLHGGSMWGNKLDNLNIYDRPEYHLDKENPEVDVYTQKVKRKRTGGRLGKFWLIWNSETRRYKNIKGDVPCNPEWAEMNNKRSKWNGEQGWLKGFDPDPEEPQEPDYF